MHRYLTSLAIITTLGILTGCTEDSDKHRYDQTALNIQGNISVFPASIAVSEVGDFAQITVYPSIQPAADVVIKASSADPGEIQFINNEVTISPANYKQGGVFHIKGIDDHIADGLQYVTLTFSAQSIDPYYQNIQPVSIIATCMDNGVNQPVVDDNPDSKPDDNPDSKPDDNPDTNPDDKPDTNPDDKPDTNPDDKPDTNPDDKPDTNPDDKPIPGEYIIVAPKTFVTTEDGISVAGSIALNRAPSGDIVITLSSSDETEGKVSPATMTFNAQNFQQPQAFTIAGQDDSEVDGSISYTVRANANSQDTGFTSGELFAYELVNLDNDKAVVDPEGYTHIRMMAANITSEGKGYNGDGTNHDDDPGQRIFKAVKADIVMIQEFNVTNESYDTFVARVFGPEFEYYRGTGVTGYTGSTIPNGVISRYPIISSGQWRPVYRKKRIKNGETTYYNEDAYKDRQWVWSVIDIPGDRDLLVVSVHLHTSYNYLEYEPLADKIAAKQKEGNYYVVLGGDFNSKQEAYNVYVNETPTLHSIFTIDTLHNPVDQNNNAKTNAKRGSQLDWVIFSKDLNAYETPTEIGAHTGAMAYAHGHVFDSRVYAKSYYNGVCELSLVPPVEANDSGVKEMQHMAIIRDVLVPK